MIHKRIANATRTLGEKQGFLPLHVRDVETGDPAITGTVNAMQTIWEPTPAELSQLIKGGFVLLTILGDAHPPVKVEVQPY